MKMSGWELFLWVVCGAFLAILLYLFYQEMKDCEDAGGVLVRTQVRSVCIDAGALK